MSKTTTYRFEVGNEDYGQIDHARSMKDALTIADRWVDRNGTPAYIFDRMAHKGKPDLWDVTACPGEAHSNPHIDHCAVCLPNWGIIVRPRPQAEPADKPGYRPAGWAKPVKLNADFLQPVWGDGSCDTCNNMSDTIFKDDGECTCGIQKHHYHCPICGKIQQVG